MMALGFISFLFPLLFLALIVLVVGALVANRGDPDTTGRRPYAIYLSLVCFVGLWASVGAAFTFIKALTDTIFVSGEPSCPPGMIDCGFVSGSSSSGRDVIQAILILAASGVLTYLHGRKLLELRGLEPGSSSPSARVLVVFGYSVSFLGMFSLLAAAIAAATSFIDLVDPEGSLAGGRDQATSTMLSSILIGALVGLIVRFCWRAFDLGLRQTPAAPPPA